MTPTQAHATLSAVSRDVLEAFITSWVEERNICKCWGCEYEDGDKQRRNEFPPCTIPDNCQSERPCEIGWLQWAIEEGEWRLRGPFDVVICSRCGMMAFRRKGEPIIVYQCGHCKQMSCDRHFYHLPDGGWFFAAWEQELGDAYRERIEGYEKAAEEATP